MSAADREVEFAGTHPAGAHPPVQPVAWTDARQFALSIAIVRAPEQVRLADAVGRTLATDVTALIDVPHYASSAMDGWAVAGGAPWRILQAGAAADTVRDGEAIAINTGGLIPHGARAVLRSESAVMSADGATVTVRTGESSTVPTDGMHIRPRGEEARLGEHVIEAGIRLNPAHIAVAAVCGHDRVDVAYRPRIRLLLTGDEVVTRGLPEPGQVRDSFGPQLRQLIGMMGGRVTGSHRVADRLDDVVAALASASGAGAGAGAGADAGGRDAGEDGASGAADASCDVIVTTGGTGQSNADHLRSGLRAVKARFIIDGIAMRPGGPCMIARLPTGPIVIALPGNPLAAVSALFSVLPPLIAGFQGAALPQLDRIRSAEAFDDRHRRTLLVPFVRRKNGAVGAGWHGAGMLRGLARAEGILVAPPEGIRIGDIAEFLPVPW